MVLPLETRALVTLLASVVMSLGACEKPRDDALLTTGKKLHSQHNEELIIRHFFRDREGGFFLDVGAFKWNQASTTLYLEKHLGWSGIAIDAQAKYAEGYEKNRPRTRFFAYLVTDSTGDMGTLHLAGPLSSTDAEHLKSFPKVVGYEPKTIQVPTITLNDLLDQNGVEKIDFLSMDIEGSEPPALAGFEIDRFRPALVCIEVSAVTRREIEAYFAQHRYERIEQYMKHDHVNWYYKPAGSR